MRNLPGLLFSILLALLLTQSGLATSPTPSPTSEDVDDLLDYLTGSYRLIGKKLDSDKPFLGGAGINTKRKQLPALPTKNANTTRGLLRAALTPPPPRRNLCNPIN